VSRAAADPSMRVLAGMGGPTTACSGRRLAPPLMLTVSRQMRVMAFIVAVTLGLSSGHAVAAESDPLPPEKWPTTLSDAVTYITERLSEDDKRLLRETKKSDLARFHHGWGMGIRNGFGLWRGNDKLIESACGKPCHPDDASMVIMEAVWAALQK